MKRLLLAAALLLVAAPLRAQGNGTYVGPVFPARAPNGGGTAPVYGFINCTTCGGWYNSGGSGSSLWQRSSLVYLSQSPTLTILENAADGTNFLDFRMDSSSLQGDFRVTANGGTTYHGLRITTSGADLIHGRLRDVSDNTKVVAFVTSSVSPGTTRNFNFPDADTRAWGLPTSSDGSVVITDNTSTFDIGDAGIYPLWSQNAGTPATCTDGREFIDDSTNDLPYWCSDTDTPVRLALYSDIATVAAATKLDDLASPDDNTDLNASASAHGLLPKLSGDSGDCFLGDGTYGTCPGGGRMVVVCSGSGGGAGAGATAYHRCDNASLDGTEFYRQFVIANACTVDAFYVHTGSSQPGDAASTWTLRDDGADTSMVVTITAGGGAGVYSDTAHTASVAAGSLLSFKIVNSSSSTSAVPYSLSFSCTP